MPKLGDRVTVGAHACVIGPVTIGDDVFIGAQVLVTRDVPAGSKVTAKMELEIRSPDRNAAATAR